MNFRNESLCRGEGDYLSEGIPQLWEDERMFNRQSQSKKDIPNKYLGYVQRLQVGDRLRSRARIGQPQRGQLCIKPGDLSRLDGVGWGGRKEKKQNEKETRY